MELEKQKETTEKTSGQLLCDYMYNPKSKVTYEDIVLKCRKESFEKRIQNLKTQPLKELKQIFLEIFSIDLRY